MALNQLDNRKTKILQTIIKTYLDTGEPVGSRTISKYTDLNLSSAWKIWVISFSLIHQRDAFLQIKDIDGM